MKKSDPLTPEAQEQFGNALDDVFSHILQRADEERKKSEPWNKLFAASEEGLKGILSESHDQMRSIALSTIKVIQQKFGIRCSNKLFHLIYALPFAMYHITDAIQEEQGNSCCVDKARHVYYEEVLDEIRKLLKEENDK
jgi:hypothetical protein